MTIDRRVLIIYASVVLVAAVLAAVITAVALGSRSNQETPPETGETLPEQEKYEPQLADIPIPEDLLVQKQLDWYPLREPIDAWSPDLAERYWIPVEDIILDHVKDDNEKAVNSLLDSIP